MSTQTKEGNILPPLQRLIILHLSKTGPQTMNKTSISIKHGYKPSLNAFKSLQQKGLLKKIRTTTYKRREFSEIWLTELGIVAAVVEGALQSDLLTNSKEVYPNNHNLQFFLTMIYAGNPNIARIIFTAFMNKGKLENIDLAMIFVTQMESNNTLEQLSQALQTYRKYPKEYKHLKEQLSNIQKNLSKLTKTI